MDELSELLTMASAGDENALKTLNLDKPVKLALDKPYVNVGIIRLTGEYGTTRALIAAVDRLKLWMLTASCRNELKYLQFIAKEFCKTTLANKPLPGETVAEVMKDLSEEIEVRRQQIEGEKKRQLSQTVKRKWFRGRATRRKVKGVRERNVKVCHQLKTLTRKSK